MARGASITRSPGRVRSESILISKFTFGASASSFRSRLRFYLFLALGRGLDRGLHTALEVLPTTPAATGSPQESSDEQRENNEPSSHDGSSVTSNQDPCSTPEFGRSAGRETRLACLVLIRGDYLTLVLRDQRAEYSSSNRFLDEAN